jgi:hypothetical protein
MDEKPISTHPVQDDGRLRRIPQVVTLRAYEVYKEKFGEQAALIDDEGRGCRGGFGMTELIAFLYAHSFPKEEWRRRVDEAFEGMERR